MLVVLGGLWFGQLWFACNRFVVVISCGLCKGFLMVLDFLASGGCFGL